MKSHQLQHNQYKNLKCNKQYESKATKANWYQTTKISLQEQLVPRCRYHHENCLEVGKVTQFRQLKTPQRYEAESDTRTERYDSSLPTTATELKAFWSLRHAAFCLSTLLRSSYQLSLLSFLFILGFLNPLIPLYKTENKSTFSSSLGKQIDLFNIPTYTEK